MVPMQQQQQTAAGGSTNGDTAAAAAAARRADATLALASALVYCVLPATTSFGAARLGAAAAAVWLRPQPANDAYDAMLIVVAACVPACAAFCGGGWRRRCHQQEQQQQQEEGEELLELLDQQQQQQQQQDQKKVLGPPRPGGVLDIFNAGFALALGVGYAAAGTPATAALWLVAAAALACLLWRASTPSGGGRWSQALAWDECWKLQPWRRRDRAEQALSVLLALIACVFVAGPVLAPWDEPVQPFVRWHPFSINGERVWRSVFASYAGGMLLAAVLGPLSRQHRPFAGFIAVSGAVHSLAMLLMWGAARAAGGPNGNAEHVYGDVLAWALVGASAGVCLWRSDG